MVKYRVWEKNTIIHTFLCVTDWTTRAKCKKYIVERWGFWPNFAFISRAKTEESFIMANFPLSKKEKNNEMSS